MANLHPKPRQRSRRIRKIGSTVHAVSPEPRRRVRASRQTFFRLYFPRFSNFSWKLPLSWTASRPRIIASVLFVVLIVGIFQLFSAPLFFVDAIQFNGNRITSPDELSQAAAVRSWNIFFVDTHEVENSLLKLPEIKEAHVGIGLPNIVQVRVVERLPRMVWETKGQTFWVDDDGIALRARTSVPGILWLKDLDGAPVQIGDRINPEAFNALVALHNLWPTGPTVFDWSRHHGLAARDSHGWLVYFGRSNQMPDKVKALQVVTAQIIKAGKPINFIDLSSGLPYYQEAPQVASSN